MKSTTDLKQHSDFNKKTVRRQYLVESINISNSVIRRLPRYYRFLGELEDQQISKISSRELSERMHLTASQIRQDLNCFGGFGQQGYGYNVSELRKEIGRILGVDKHRKTILIGAGNLGTALAVHINFEKADAVLLVYSTPTRKLSEILSES